MKFLSRLKEMHDNLTIEQRFKIQKYASYAKRASEIARESFDIYNSIKKKDYFSLGLGALSATGIIADSCRVDFEEGNNSFFTRMGLKVICYSTGHFVRDLLRSADVSVKIILGEHEEKTSIEEYDLENSKAYFYVWDGHDANHGAYVADEQQFYKDISNIIYKKFGNYLILNRMITKKDSWATIQISSINILNDTYVNSNEINENIIIDNINKFFQKGLNRSMLFFGPPGTGKTTLAIRITKALGGKILIVDGQSLARGSTNLAHIINIIDPTVILFDDFDRIGSPSDLLSSVERLNIREKYNRGRLFIATVNDLSKIPTPLRRPGRFDQSIEFKMPNKENRFDVLCAYAKQFESTLKEEELQSLADTTEDMTQAYLKEIVLRASILGTDKIASDINHMRKVALFKDGSKPNVTDEEDFGDDGDYWKNEL